MTAEQAPQQDSQREGITNRVVSDLVKQHCELYPLERLDLCGIDWFGVKLVRWNGRQEEPDLCREQSAVRVDRSQIVQRAGSNGDPGLLREFPHGHRADVLTDLAEPSREFPDRFADRVAVRAHEPDPSHPMDVGAQGKHDGTNHPVRLHYPDVAVGGTVRIVYEHLDPGVVGEDGA